VSLASVSKRTSKHSQDYVCAVIDGPDDRDCVYRPAIYIETVPNPNPPIVEARQCGSRTNDLIEIQLRLTVADHMGLGGVGIG
jgi:hypothetical protein